MSTTRTGRDGRPLVTTAQAAYSLGKTPAQFRSWARRRALTPASSMPNPSRGQALALWDLADIATAVRQPEPTRPVCQEA
ncbi:hypothetical protein [Streptomyces sp. NPDC052535]|uniref:hypothetical protein n=1 Tax=Streptomyces sp. NPDC052535 TaxID=3155531 RepID=UPI003445171C